MVYDRRQSRRAAAYDSFALPQTRSALRLLELIPDGVYSTVMEPGCGTGLYTEMLRGRYPSATIVAFDRSEVSVAVARRKTALANVAFDVADATTWESERVDLVSCNGVFHWLRDPDTVVDQYVPLLRPSGTLAFSAFGSATLRELTRAVQSVFRDYRPVADGFPGADDWRAAMARRGLDGRVITETFEITYTSLKELLLAIRNTGVQGNHELPWTPARFRWVEEAYLAANGAISATYELHYVCASADGLSASRRLQTDRAFAG